jgi:hypothetical protein
MSLARHVDALAARLPNVDPRKAELRARIARLSGECGCRMSGIFLLGAAGLTVAYLLALRELSLGSALLAFAFVFAMGLLGKLVGLGVAQLRLLAVRRSVLRRLSAGEVRDVQLH